jgi:hypothetical protein
VCLGATTADAATRHQHRKIADLGNERINPKWADPELILALDLYSTSRLREVAVPSGSSL